MLLQIPKSLRKSLVEVADREGVSLNQYILSVLNEANEKILAMQ
nr:toxin-antitoxin system HicB family antitoxin [Iningainema tapete]